MDAAVPVALTAAQAPQPVGSARVRVLRLYRVSPVGFVGCLGVGLANGAWWALAPVYGHGVGLLVTGIALLMSATVIGDAFGQWPIGYLSDRIDRRKLLVAVCAIAAEIGATQAPLGQQSSSLLIGLGICWGAVVFPIYTLSVAAARHHRRFPTLSENLARPAR